MNGCGLGGSTAMHVDVAVRTSLRARAAPDAVLFDDRDLAARQADDAVHAAEQAHRVFAVAARGREKEVIDLEAAELQAAVFVTACARVDAVLAVDADVHVDDEDFAAGGEALLDEDVHRHDGARGVLRPRSRRGGENASLRATRFDLEPLPASSAARACG
jgi:hypothetical protein